MENLQKKENMISVNETIYDGLSEQGIELDHVLPDYYPEIFKILDCRIYPRIADYNLISENKLMYDGTVDIKVIYLAENNNDLHCVEQRYTYSKTVDLSKGAVPENCEVSISLQPKSDYCNCRAVSGRRLDIRGAVSTRIRISTIRECSTPVMPENVQVKNAKYDCCCEMKTAEKQFTCKEEIETGTSGIAFIIRSNAIPCINETRIIADKVIVKGTITINAAYGIYNNETGGCETVEQMTADIPFSQIIDIDGIDDNCRCSARINILNCELTCSNGSGILGCNIYAVCCVSCQRHGTVELPCDVFSTEYETEHSTRLIRLVKNCCAVEKTVSVSTSCSADNMIESVIDCNAELSTVSCHINEDKAVINGVVVYHALCRTEEGIPYCIEKQENFESEMALGCNADEIQYTAFCADTDYSIKSDGTIDITAKLQINADICETASAAMTENVTFIEDRPKQKNSEYALRICYADGNEDCWSIAKHYSAPVKVIMEENDIVDEDMPLSGMVLIPSN